MPLIRNSNPPPVPEVKVDANPPPAPEIRKPAPKLDKETYWERKEERDIERDRRMSRAGLFQAALQSPAIMQFCPTMESYMEQVRKVAEEGLKFVNQKD